MSARIPLPTGLVTFLFTDIESSTRLVQALGPEYRRVLMEHRQVLREVWARYGGTELFTEGDSVFVAFCDAAAALRACTAGQIALAGHEWPWQQFQPRVRMGLHSGHAVPIGGEYASAEVHRAARIAAAAHGGQVLCSAATARAAGDPPELLDLGLHRLRGFDGRERLYQLVASGMERSFPRPRTELAPAHNLPVLPGRFIGRDSEQAELVRALAGNRMVSVLGPGGVGKTRLAVEVATDLVDRYADGVWFVDLSTVTDPGGVDAAVAAVLGLRTEPGRQLADTIAEHLASRQLLLVLDTCDAHPAAARRLAVRALAAGAEVCVMATGRQPLGASGELVWRLPPLNQTPSTAGGYSDAVALLVDRACSARGGRRCTIGEIGDFIRVAAAIDGLPLAIELAAARLRVLSAAQLVGRIGDSLDVLDAGAGDVDVDLEGDAEGRHRCMRANVAWSYRALDDSAARLLRQLSVFTGSIDMAAIEWIAGCDRLDALATLVDTSLLQVEYTPVGATYRMLAPIRAYAGRLLSESGEERAVHLRYMQLCTYRSGQSTAPTRQVPVLRPMPAVLTEPKQYAVL